MSVTHARRPRRCLAIRQRMLFAAVSAAGIAALAAPRVAEAAITWSGGAGGGSAWISTSNWAGGAIPTGTDIAQFDTAGTAITIGINLGTPSPANNNGAHNQAVGEISLTGGISRTINNSSATDGTLTLNAVTGLLISNSSTALSLTIQDGTGKMPIMLGNSGTIEVVNSGALVTINSVINELSIGLTLTKTGSGSLVLSATNAYTGATTISGGTLQIGGGGTSGSVVNDIVDNAVLAFNRSDSYATSNNISGSGVVQNKGSGVLTLAGNNSYLGGTKIDGGTVSIASNAKLGDVGGAVTFNGGALRIGADITSARPFTFAGAGTIDTNGSSLTLSSAISGSGALNKVGAGRLAVQTAAVGRTGSTSISAGVLRVEDAAGLGSGAITVGAASLELAGVTMTAPNLTLNNGANLLAAGASEYDKTSFPSVAASASIAFQAAGASDVLTIGSPVRNGSGGTISVIGSGTVALDSGATASDAFSGNWYVNMTGGVLVVNQVNGLGNSASTPANATVVSGSLVSGTPSAIPNALTLAGGALAATGGNRSFSGAVTLQSSTTSTLSLVDPSNGSTARNVTIGGPIGGSGHILISGTGIASFTADSNYTGNTTVSGGTLSLVSSTSTNNIGSSPILTVNTGANLDVSGITAAGNFKLANNQKLRGGGSVYGTFTADAGSTIAPGTSAGKITFAGASTNITLDTNSTYEVEIGGDGVGAGAGGVDYDQIIVNGSSKTIDLGTAKLKLLPLANIVTNQPYRIVTATGAASVATSSIFRNLAGNLNAGGPYTDGPLTYNIAYGYGSGGFVDVTFSTVPEPSLVTLLGVACGSLLMRRRR